jgi:hypothetical protein
VTRFALTPSSFSCPPPTGHSHLPQPHLVCPRIPTQHDFVSSPVTSIHERSFAGLAVAHLTMTLVVCGGLLLLLPASVSASGAATIGIVPAGACAASPDRVGDQEFTANAAGLDAPDSCNDEDDEDDGDDDSSGGSGQAIAASHHTPANHNDVSHLVHLDSDTHRRRPLDAHSLRGPPQTDERSDERSSDADVDGDDDDPRPEHSVILPAASRSDASLRGAADFLSPSSTRFSNISLRAPPL